MNLAIKEVCQKLWDISQKLVISEEQDIHDSKDSMIENIEQAKKEWIDAKKLFEEVSDPDLIDHLIYQIEASQKKYTYLLKKARKENLVNEEIKITLENFMES